VISAASIANPTVAAGVIGRRRCGARDTKTPVPRYRGGAPPGRRCRALRDTGRSSSLAGIRTGRQRVGMGEGAVWMSVIAVVLPSCRVDHAFEAYSIVRSNIEHVIESLPSGTYDKAVHRQVPARTRRFKATRLEQVFDKSADCDYIRLHER
jgi:hypothetical protein